jgi:hypothetical protein
MLLCVGMYEDKKARFAGRLPVRVGAAVAVVLAALFVAWVVFGTPGDDGKPEASITNPGTSTGGGTNPVALSFSGLKTLVGALHQPVYWVGTKRGTSYEFRQLANGIVYLRYLPTGTQAGDPNTFLTVGTYPVSNAYAISQQIVKGSDVSQIEAGDNAVAYSSTKSTNNAYVVFSGSDYQIEVYSPTPGVARSFIAQGAVAPVPGGTTNGVGVTGTTAPKLKRLATSLGQPIYWASARPQTTLEVRQTAQGYVYVRYLPKGVAVGDPGQYLSVATYPLDNAFAVTEALGKKAGNTTVQLAGGGIAVFSKTAGADAYVAFPGSDFQIEVFDPKPGAARDLVSANKIAPLG